MKQTLSNRRWLIAALLFLGFMVIVTLSADVRWIPTKLAGIPFSDKIGHFGLYGILAFLLNLALSRRAVQIGPIRIPLALLIVCTLGILDEAQQSFSPYRSVDIRDLTADWVGVTVGVLLASSLPLWHKFIAHLQLHA